MKKLFYLLAALSGCFFQFCTYSPNGEHFEEVDPTPKVEGASITLGDNEDTLRVHGTMQVHYSLNLPHLKLYQAHFLLNGKSFYSTKNLTGSFTLDSESIPDGVHELKVLLNTTTGTNSLADKLEAEQLELYQTWKVLVDNAPPSKVKITGVEILDGRLRVRWEQYKRMGAKSFMLFKHDLATYYPLYITSFTSPDSTAWVDHSYLGGKVGYSIVVRDDKGRSTAGDVFPFEVPIPQIKSYQFYNNEQDLRVHFSAARLYRNFNDYMLNGYTGPYDSDARNLLRTTNLNDTVVTIQNSFPGRLTRLRLITWPKENRHQMGTAWHEVMIR